MARSTVRREYWIWFLVPPVALMAAMLVAPLLEIFHAVALKGNSSMLLFQHLRSAALYRDTIVNTLELALLVSAGTFLLGYPLAYLILHSPSSRQRFLLGVA